MSLIRTVKVGEVIRAGDIKIRIVLVKGKQVRLAFDAPDSIRFVFANRECEGKMGTSKIICLMCGKDMGVMERVDADEKPVTHDECDACVFERHQAERGFCDCGICEEARK